MTEQFPHTQFTNAAAQNTLAAHSKTNLPNFRRTFISLVTGLGLLTVLGVSCYSASMNLVQQTGTIVPKSTEVEHIAPHAAPIASDTYLEPMVAVHTDPNSASNESPLPPIDSPVAPQKPKQLRQKPSVTSSPTIQIVVAPKAEEIPVQVAPLQSAKTHSSEADQAPDSKEEAPTIESPVPDAEGEIAQGQSEFTPPSE